MDLDDFKTDFSQSVHARKDVSGMYFEDAFFDVFSEYLIESGEIDDAERVHFDTGRGVRVDGYGGDPRDSDGNLTLIISDPHPESDAGNLTMTEMEKLFRRLEAFLDRAIDRKIEEAVEESAPVWGLAELVRTRWPEVRTLRLLILSNRPLSSRVDRKDAGDVHGIPTTYGVWDISRLHRFVSSGMEREALEVDFAGDFGASVPALHAGISDAGYEAYLAVLPASQLAEIYDRWGARLLEQNVRVFLQARSKVNKGIRNTLQNESHMFFAYNNGIAATAEDVSAVQTEDGLRIDAIQNLQIVNGGQTTASIHRAKMVDGADLDGVYVQMKLAVIPPDRVREVVPLISRYANSQNRVSEADFFSNHPFHIRIEEFSRRVFAPSVDGEFQQTKWFYERARGQFNDARAYLTRAQRREFDTTHPRRQMFRKTDLAKFENVWRMIPQTVSKGAQKNFADFAEHVSKRWKKSDLDFNERYYRHLIAKAIVFRSMERLVSAADWYPGGYRANIVAYSISRLALEFDRQGLTPDFDSIWESQELPEELESALDMIGQKVTSILDAPPEGIANVTEWAKKEACWDRVQAIKLPSGLLGGLGLSAEEETGAGQDARRDMRVVQGIEAQMLVHSIGHETWGKMYEWATLKKLLSVKQKSILETCADPTRLPSEKQAGIAIEAMIQLHEEGCVYGKEALDSGGD